VLIVCCADQKFAIVGSGNLSKGVLQTNCECGVFVSNPTSIASLSHWFDTEFAKGVPLTAQMITAYEPKYRKAKKLGRKLAECQKSAEKKVRSVGELSLTSWNHALRMAER